MPLYKAGNLFPFLTTEDATFKTTNNDPSGEPVAWVGKPDRSAPTPTNQPTTLRVHQSPGSGNPTAALVHQQPKKYAIACRN
ncbi:MAG: hypothetical protein ACHBN1_04690 [Heteroscytonema crispum UTEX LB 1556]